MSFGSVTVNVSSPKKTPVVEEERANDRGTPRSTHSHLEITNSAGVEPVLAHRLLDQRQLAHELGGEAADGGLQDDRHGWCPFNGCCRPIPVGRLTGSAGSRQARL
ncbi:hypothetical protein ACQ86E_19500 [Bradyrhizobium betae]|uniref:hypothetical protein n=1 Tax=Bradyrhizobium betae TaxID=244734 RepID=UPI003D67ADCB